MSIYSGFATRRDQTKYSHLLIKLLQLLQSHLTELVDHEMLKKKIIPYSKIISKMREYEDHKYLPPKFSEYMKPLCKVIGITGKDRDKDSQRKEEHEGEDKSVTQMDKLKRKALSTHKNRMKYKLFDDVVQMNRVKKGSLMEDYKNDLSPDNLYQIHKRSNYQSVTELKQKKINTNLSKEKVEVSNTYEEQESVKGGVSEEKQDISASHPVILFNKIKANHTRYRALHALGEAQQNHPKKVFNHHPPQIRRRLKTTEQKPQDKVQMP